MRVEPFLESLASYRPLFHSEADFQHSLAWEIQRHVPEAKVRLEVPIGGMAGRGAVDIVVRHDGIVYGFELKYLKRKLVHEHDGEAFDLADTGEANAARYAICKDIIRLEHMVGTGQIHRGFLIVLANDANFWRADSKVGTIDEQFKLTDGRTLRGTLAWGERAGKWTGGAGAALKFAGEYPLAWQEYSQLDGKDGRFRALVVPIDKGIAAPSANEVAPAAAGPERSTTNMPADGRSELRRLFHGLDQTEIVMTFDEIEEYLGPLPASASNHNAWWHHVASHAHAVWELEGFFASPQLAARRVIFSQR